MDTEIITDVLMLGDSHMFYGEWENWFPCYNILNRGIGNDTVEGVLSRLDEALSHFPKIVFLMCGINDIAGRIAESETIANMSAVVDKIHRVLPECKIVLFSVLPTENRFDINKIISMNKQYAVICEDKEYVQYCDLTDLFMENGEAGSKFFSDGLHLNSRGYIKLIAEIEKYLEKYLD